MKPVLLVDWGRGVVVVGEGEGESVVGGVGRSLRVGGCLLLGNGDRTRDEVPPGVVDWPSSAPVHPPGDPLHGLGGLRGHHAGGGQQDVPLNLLPHVRLLHVLPEAAGAMAAGGQRPVLLGEGEGHRGRQQQGRGGARHFELSFSLFLIIN